MTQGKLKMYRRDRLYTSDKDRLQNLQDCLRNVRITDESAFFNSMPENSSSPTKGGNRARDGLPPAHKGPGGGRGGDRGGAGAGAGGGSSGYGGYSGQKNMTGSAADKSGSNPKGASDYSSQARGNARTKQMAMKDTTNNFNSNFKDAQPVLKNYNGITDKRSKSSQNGKNSNATS